MDEECSVLQEEEREALLSIYDGDEAFKQVSPTIYQYKVRLSWFMNNVNFSLYNFFSFLVWYFEHLYSDVAYVGKFFLKQKTHIGTEKN